MEADYRSAPRLQSLERQVEDGRGGYCRRTGRGRVAEWQQQGGEAWPADLDNCALVGPYLVSASVVLAKSPGDGTKKSTQARLPPERRGAECWRCEVSCSKTARRRDSLSSSTSQEETTTQGVTRPDIARAQARRGGDECPHMRPCSLKPRGQTRLAAPAKDAASSAARI